MPWTQWGPDSEENRKLAEDAIGHAQGVPGAGGGDSGDWKELPPGDVAKVTNGADGVQVNFGPATPKPAESTPAPTSPEIPTPAAAIVAPEAVTAPTEETNHA